MCRDILLLRFEDRLQAIALLGALGAEFQPAGEDGIIHQPTGETVEFEGERIALTCAVAGYHISLAWQGDVPDSLKPYLASRNGHVTKDC